MGPDPASAARASISTATAVENLYTVVLVTSRAYQGDLAFQFVSKHHCASYCENLIET